MDYLADIGANMKFSSNIEEWKTEIHPETLWRSREF